MSWQHKVENECLKMAQDQPEDSSARETTEEFVKCSKFLGWCLTKANVKNFWCFNSASGDPILSKYGLDYFWHALVCVNRETQKNIQFFCSTSLPLARTGRVGLTQGCWVRSKYATSVLYIPPPPPQEVVTFGAGISRKSTIFCYVYEKWPKTLKMRQMYQIVPLEVLL